MFKDKSDYELAMPHLMEIWEDDARELIKALRNVARASRRTIPFSSSEMTSVEEGGKRMGVLIESLKALPPWVLEED